MNGFLAHKQRFLRLSSGAGCIRRDDGLALIRLHVGQTVKFTDLMNLSHQLQFLWLRRNQVAVAAPLAHQIDVTLLEAVSKRGGRVMGNFHTVDSLHCNIIG